MVPEFQEEIGILRVSPHLGCKVVMVIAAIRAHGVPTALKVLMCQREAEEFNQSL